MAAFALILACVGAVEHDPSPVRGHFGTWTMLVRAADRGDLEAARREARLLAADPAVEDSDGGARVGAAVGFVLVAGADDLVDGVEAVGRACAGCHEGVLAPPAPAGDERAWGLIFPGS